MSKVSAKDKRSAPVTQQKSTLSSKTQRISKENGRRTGLAQIKCPKLFLFDFDYIRQRLEGFRSLSVRTDHIHRVACL